MKRQVEQPEIGFVRDPEHLTLTAWRDNGYRLVLLDESNGKVRIVVRGDWVRDRKDAADGFRQRVDWLLSRAIEHEDRKEIEIR